MEPVLVVIVASPGPLREGLRVLLKTLPSVNTMQLADNANFLLTTPMPVPPRVIVWDWSCLLAEAGPALAKVQARWPATRTLALVADEEQRGGALLAGVDAVVTKGTPATRLLAAVTNLLHKSQAGSDADLACLAGGNVLDQPLLAPFTSFDLVERPFSF